MRAIGYTMGLELLSETPLVTLGIGRAIPSVAILRVVGCFQDLGT